MTHAQITTVDQETSLEESYWLHTQQRVLLFLCKSELNRVDWHTELPNTPTFPTPPHSQHPEHPQHPNMSNTSITDTVAIWIFLTFFSFFPGRFGKESKEKKGNEINKGKGKKNKTKQREKDKRQQGNRMKLSVDSSHFDLFQLNNKQNKEIFACQPLLSWAQLIQHFAHTLLPRLAFESDNPLKHKSKVSVSAPWICLKLLPLIVLVAISLLSSSRSSTSATWRDTKKSLSLIFLQPTR